MDTQSVLETIAEVAVTITGFAGIVGAVAGDKLHPTHPEVWLPFWAMISSGLCILFAALLPLLSSQLGAPDPVTWAASSLLVVTLTVGNLVFFMPRIRRAQRESSFPRLRAISVPLDLSSVAIVVSQGLNALGVGLEQSAGGFLIGLYALLFTSGLNFVFLLYVLALEPRR